MRLLLVGLFLAWLIGATIAIMIGILPLIFLIPLIIVCVIVEGPVLPLMQLPQLLNAPF